MHQPISRFCSGDEAIEVLRSQTEAWEQGIALLYLGLRKWSEAEDLFAQYDAEVQARSR